MRVENKREKNEEEVKTLHKGIRNLFQKCDAEKKEKETT